MAFGDVLTKQKTTTTGFGSVLTNKTTTGFGGFGLQTPDLTTSQGLQQLAKQTELETKAKKILATKGEQPKQIFSGGFISDIFDSLNALQYGVVGVIKGKGFSEGVKTRQSFSDKDALGDYGIPGMIGGIALDIAVDPLTYIAPWTILKKVGLVEKLKGVSKVAEASKVGQWFGRKFVYMFGADPVFREVYERSIKNIVIGGNNISDMVKGVANIAPDTAKKILTKDKTGRFIRTPLNQIKNLLSPKEFDNVSNLYKYLDDLGGQAVDLGLLKKGTWEANLGEYIKNAYLEYEQKKGGGGLFGFMKLGIKGIKQRKNFWGVSYQPKGFAESIVKKFDTKDARDIFIKGLQKTEGFFEKGGKILQQFSPIPLEKLQKLGQIDNPAYLLFKSNIDLMKDVENAKLFRLVGQKFGAKTLKEGFKQLPDVKRLGELSNKYVPENIFDYIQEISKPAEYSFGKKAVAGFKYAKVIMNPATHARNVMSNEILNWWKLGLGPWRQDIYVEALGQIKKGGKYIDEAKSVGYNLNTFASNEIRNILLGPEGKSALGKNINKFANKLGDIYQGEENFAKLAAFIFKRKGGLGIEDAWKAAESATFNYAQVTPFIRMIRESLFGFPFITFTYKATPIAVETALKFPRRISAFGKIKNAIESQSDIKETERERASEPAWIRDGFYIKLPIKDKEGRSAYFDLTYIIPFGDIVSGNYFTRNISRETGLPESIPESAMQQSPFFNVIKELAKNQDFYGDKIWNESDSTEKQLGNIMRHLTKTYMPPLIADQIPGGYMTSGERRQKGIGAALNKEQEIKQQRTLMQELLRNMGFKIQPIDVDIQETYMEWEKKKALETLLKESNVLKEFNRMYIPK